MDLSQEFLIDLAINAGGYLAVALLSMVMYSLFNRKKSAPTDAVISTASVATPAPAQRETGKVEFVRFGEQVAAAPRPATHATAAATDADNGRRNRSEVMDIARKMLSAGAPPERIKRVLPISEVELALLNMNNS